MLLKKKVISFAKMLLWYTVLWHLIDTHEHFESLILLISLSLSCPHFSWHALFFFPWNLHHEQNMLRQLYLKAPFTVGMFRRSANARVCREVEASLEQDPLFSLEDVSVIVVGAVFKVSMLIYTRRSLCIFETSMIHYNFAEKKR